MSFPERTLGTLLRHLIELLDSGVQEAYDALGLDYRPRFTPVVRTLRDPQAKSIRTIAAEAGLTHSAASQTVQLMRQSGFVESAQGEDGRERRVVASAKLRALLPALETQWLATNAAAAELDRELHCSLHRAASDAIEALEAIPFAARIATHTQGVRT